MKTSLLFKIPLLVLTVAAGTLSSSALSTSYYATTSKLASGKWVKIRVAEEGIFEITADSLRSWGFDDPSKVTVWGYGGTELIDNRYSTQTPDDMWQQYSYYDSSRKKLLFYGVADINPRVISAQEIKSTRNFYSSYGYYFLTDSQNKRSLTAISGDSGTSSTIDYHYHLEYIENEVQNPASGGVFFFDRSIVNSPLTYSFPVKDFSTSAGVDAALFYKYASDTQSGLRLNVTCDNNRFTIKGSVPELAAVDGQKRTFTFAETGTTPQKLAYNTDVSDNKADITFAIDPAYNVTGYAAIDYAALLYPRTNSMSEVPQLLMNFPVINSGAHIKIYGTTSSTQIWNVDDPKNVRVYSTNYNSSANPFTMITNDKRYNSAGALRVIAFNPGCQQKAVEFVGKVANQNLHGEAIPDMVIVTPAKFLDQANELAEIHRGYQGMDVRVIGQEEIYNEFSSGTPSAHGLRRYFKMLYDRDPQKFKYLLFFGIGSWDNRHLFTIDDDHLITYQTEDATAASLVATCYATDSFFGMFNDNFTTPTITKMMMDINVGRFPVEKVADAQIAVNKIRNYLNNPPVNGTYNRALIFCDDGETNSHMIQSDEIADIIQEKSPSTTVIKAYNALYPFSEGAQATALRRAITHNLKEGLGYLSYAGHGRPDMLGSDQVLWNLADIDNTDYETAPFTVLSTCDAFSYDRKPNDITSHMIRKPNGGAISIVASCRTVYKRDNHRLNVNVAESYFTATPGQTTGDVFRIGRNKTQNIWVTDNKTLVNTLSYNLAGDPAIPTFAPDLLVETLTIDGVDATTGDAIEIHPLKQFVISGRITEVDGTPVNDYNGKVTIDIYDGPVTKMSLTQGGDSSIPLELDETLMTRVQATVEEGVFTASVVLPKPATPGVSNRISYYATNTDHSRFAAAACNSMVVLDYDPSTAGLVEDTTAPEITEFYLNDPTFVSGDEINTEATVYIHINADDMTGFNYGGGRIGESPKLTLDGNQTFTPINLNLNIEDGSADVVYDLSELSDGYHTLTFSLADNAGNLASQTIGFVVVNRNAQGILEVAENPARTAATFSLMHSFKNEPAGRLVIEDMGGNTVYSREDCTFPFEWDLTYRLLDENGLEAAISGQRVPDGRYNAYVVLQSGKQYGNTAKIPVMVIK